MVFKNLFHSSPDWIDTVMIRGCQATATVLADPTEIIRLAGKTEWVDLPVEVKVYDGEQFLSNMKCKLDALTGQSITKGTILEVKFDPLNRKRVLLVSQSVTDQYTFSHPG